MRSPSRHSAVSVACILTLLVVFDVNVTAKETISRTKRETSPGAKFNWSSIQPSTQLRWTPCWEQFECTRFEIPLDYMDSSAGKGAIALMRSPSPLARTKSRYQGPLLINPGGPGESGVEMLKDDVDTLRKILGNTFDIIGFDPRGVGASTPSFLPFVSEAEAGLYYIETSQTLNHSADAFGTWFANAHTFGALSAARTAQLAQYVGTPAVARDMLGIVKAHGLDKLQYLGVSYGTVIGATFAAMFPANVGRLVLDGVVDVMDYYKGSGGWLENLVDADSVLHIMYQSCVDAGPLNCPLYQPTADKINRRVQALLKKIAIDPEFFFTKGQGLSPDTYGVVNYSLVKKVIFAGVYEPSNSGPEILAALAALEEGNTTAIWQLSGMGAIQDFVVRPPACPASSLQAVSAGSVPIAIACGDGEQSTEDVDTLRTEYSKLTQTSVFADVWTVHMFCSGWKVRAKDHFNASFQTKTSYPILFVSNTMDPVTPLRNAKLMSSLFNNSVLLIQNAAGHTATSNPSTCTVSAIRNYVQHGILPAASIVCQPDNGISSGGLTTREQVDEGSIGPPMRFPFTLL